MRTLFLLALKLLLPVIAFSQAYPLQYKKQIYDFLIAKKEIGYNDTSFMNKKEMASFVKFAVLDSCKNVGLFTIRSTSVHSKTYFGIVNKNTLSILENEDVSIIINEVNKYYLSSACPTNNREKIRVFDYLIKQIQSQVNYLTPRQR